VSIEHSRLDLVLTEPLWGMENIVQRGTMDTTSALRSLGQSLSLQLGNLQSELESQSDLYDALSSEIEYTINSLRRSMELAIGQSTKDIVRELDRVAQFLDLTMMAVGNRLDHVSHQLDKTNNQLGYIGTKLDKTNQQLVTLNWSATQLVSIGRQVVDVLRNPLANTARQHIEQGLLWFYQQEFELAEKQLLKSLRHDTTAYLAYYHLGHIHLIRNNWSEARRSFELATKCARTTGHRVRGLINLAQACHRLGDFQQAFQISSIIVKLDATNATYWLGQALYGAWIGQSIKTVLGIVQKAIDIDEACIPIALLSDFPSSSNKEFVDYQKAVRDYLAKRARWKRQKLQRKLAQKEAIAKKAAEQAELDAKTKRIAEQAKRDKEVAEQAERVEHNKQLAEQAKRDRQLAEQAERDRQLAEQAERDKRVAERERRDYAHRETARLLSYVKAYLHGLMQCIDVDYRLWSLLFRNCRLRKKLRDLIRDSQVNSAGWPWNFGFRIEIWVPYMRHPSMCTGDNWDNLLFSISSSVTDAVAQSYLRNLLVALEQFAVRLDSLGYSFEPPRAP